jgi:hypothetical protein
MKYWISQEGEEIASPTPSAAPLAMSASAVLSYLREALAADPLSPLTLGLKRCLKSGAALHTGLEHVPPGEIRRLAGRYVLYACIQLDTLVDALPDFTRASLVHHFVRECVERSRTPRALAREVLTCRELSVRERVQTLMLLRGLHRLVRATEARLDSPERIHFFRRTLTSLLSAVVEDMNLEARAHDRLDALAPEYPAMGLSGLEVLWLLQGRPLEEIITYRTVLGLAEQLARLEDDVFEVWKAMREEREEAAVEKRVDRRNLVLRHAKNLRWTMRASMDEACRISGEVELRLEEELAQVADADIARELRRVVGFFPAFVDKMIGPHRIPAPRREAAPAEPLRQVG